MNYYCCVYLFIQLEQEIDIILEKRDVLKTAQQDLSSTWVPAILQYGASCTGKTAAAIPQAKKDCEGTYISRISLW